jgi:hypothetical protein
MNKNRTPIKNVEPCPTGKGTTYGYMLEARNNYINPVTIRGLTLDNRWRRVGHHEGDVGIPRGKYRDHALDAAGLVKRHEAEALRWWFICAAEEAEGMRSICLETRIVECKVEYSFSSTQIAYVDSMDRRGDEPKD